MFIFFKSSELLSSQNKEGNSSGGYSLGAGRGLLIVVAPFVTENRIQAVGLR